MFKRAALSGGAFLTTIVLGAVIGATPVCATPGEEGLTWQLTQAFGNAMRDIQARNEQYLFVWLLLLILAVVGLILSVRYFQKKPVNNENMLQKENSGERQQRNWMRLDLEQELFYALDGTKEYKRAKLINVSGGGLLLSSNETFQKDDKIKIKLELSPGEELNLLSQVKRIAKKSDNNGNMIFTAGVQFLNIKKNEQDKIATKVLQGQHQMVVDQKRRNNGECIICGRLLPENDRGVVLYCSRCSNGVQMP